MSYRGYTISSRHIDGCPEEISLVQFRGSITAEDCDHFSRDLRIICEGGRYVAADFSRIEYISSSALGLLADIFMHNSNMQGVFCVCSLQADPLRVCKITGIGEIIPVFPDVSQALWYLQNACKGIDLTAAEISRSLDESLLLDELDFHQGLQNLHTLLIAPEGDPLAILMRGRLEAGKDNAICAPDTGTVARELEKRQFDLLVINNDHAQYREICELANSHPRQPTLSIISFGEAEGEGIAQRFEKLVKQIFPAFTEIEKLTQDQIQQLVASQQVFHREADMLLHSDEHSRHTAEAICRKLSLICGLNGEKADNFFFAVREAIDNACEHGNKMDSRKKVSLCFRNTGSTIEMTITDQGQGFDYTEWLHRSREINPLMQAREQSLLGRTGGLGIMLMNRCCDKMVYHHPGNSLTISENIS